MTVFLKGFSLTCGTNVEAQMYSGLALHPVSQPLESKVFIIQLFGFFFVVATFPIESDNYR